jgi:hypothetical protein
MISGMYLWALLGYDVMAGPVTAGASLSLPRAMLAAEGSLSDPRGFFALVEEVSLRMNVTGLDDHYTASGRKWLGRRTRSGGIRWDYRYEDRSAPPGGASPPALSDGERPAVAWPVVAIRS